MGNRHIEPNTWRCRFSGAWRSCGSISYSLSLCVIFFNFQFFICFALTFLFYLRLMILSILFYFYHVFCCYFRWQFEVQLFYFVHCWFYVMRKLFRVFNLYLTETLFDFPFHLIYECSSTSNKFNLGFSGAIKFMTHWSTNIFHLFSKLKTGFLAQLFCKNSFIVYKVSLSLQNLLV